MWLAAVGRAPRGPLRALFDDYAGRLAPTPFGPVTLKEVEVRKRLPAGELSRREAELLLAAVPPAATMVVLDERGTALASEAFAARLAGWRDTGVADLAFLIGGADGHGEAVRRRADVMLAFGPMTWPHQLVRVMLAEQIYRAHTILTGHPYHRG